MKNNPTPTRSPKIGIDETTYASNQGIAQTAGTTPTETESKYEWADWQLAETRPGLKPMNCDVCGDVATHLAIAVEKSAFDPDEEILKRRCDKHFGNTQKKWLQRWRRKNL